MLVECTGGTNQDPQQTKKDMNNNGDPQVHNKHPSSFSSLSKFTWSELGGGEEGGGEEEGGSIPAHSRCSESAD